MAEEQTVFINPEIKMETGKNIKDLIDYESSIYGVKFNGNPIGLSQVLGNLGMLPPAKKENLPGYLDDIANAFGSDDPVLLRKNKKGEQVPARWYEYMDDRQDIVAGVFGDYFAKPILYTIGGFLAGLKSKEPIHRAEKFIQEIYDKYPIDNVEGVRKVIEEGEKTRGTVGEPLSFAQFSDMCKLMGKFHKDSVLMSKDYIDYLKTKQISDTLRNNERIQSARDNERAFAKLESYAQCQTCKNNKSSSKK